MRKHKILDHNIVLGTILLYIIANVPIMLIPMLGESNDVLFSFLMVLGGIVALLVFRWIFRGEFLGFIRGGEHRTGIRLISVMLLYYLFLVCQMLICGEFAAPTLLTFANACVAGCAEEVIYRGYLISYLFRHKNNLRAIPWILVASMVLFGLAHLTNIFGGAAPAITILQVIGTMGIGALFAAVYMRSGNLLICMVAHWLNDLIAFMDRAQTSEEGLLITQITPTNYVDIVLCIALAACAFYLIRPSKREEIVALWDKKWLREQVQA